MVETLASAKFDSRDWAVRALIYDICGINLSEDEISDFLFEIDRAVKKRNVVLNKGDVNVSTDEKGR